MADDWDAPGPHLIRIAVAAADIDAYQHVNNAVYLSWLDRVAWSHSAALGVPLEECVRIGRGMAAHRTEIDYLRAVVLGDEVQVATWIVATDQRLRVERRFQIRRLPDGLTVARARIVYVCINLHSGRATRMPERFVSAYVVTGS
ncbi:MAG: acyl-CoA thioesterase [Sinobacteraceae bacterium]|nr:acyl-CoA thioesterase [Nevskiaceae bacterium]